MRITERKIRELVPDEDYARGLAYYQQGRVHGYREMKAADSVKISCSVQGTRLYSVIASYSAKGVAALCTCRRFGELHSCKHLVAALLTFAHYRGDGAKSDLSVSRMLEAYLNRPESEVDPTRQAQLVPRLTVGSYAASYPSLSFRVGFDKLYVVKNIKTFLELVSRGEEARYGKGLLLCHAASQFDGPSRALIALLMNEFRSFRTFEPGDAMYDDYENPMKSRSELQLTGAAFDRFFQIYLHRQVACSLENCDSVLLEEGDPPVTLRLRGGTDRADLAVELPEGCRFFGYSGALYALCGEKLLRCSRDFQERVYPMLSIGSREMKISLSDLPAFCSCVLPEVRDWVCMEDPDRLLQQYAPEECTPRYYFDLDEDRLLAELRFRYGEREVPYGPAATQDLSVKRNARQEQAALAPLRRCLQEDRAGFFFLEGENEIFDFLTETLDSFHAYGEVYVSQRLGDKQIRPSRPVVGISVSEGLLSLDIDTGEFPPEELEALYASLLKKQKYHKLKDGRFLTLGGSPYETLAEMVHMTRLPPGELAGGHVTVPAFRGLYLDGVLSGDEGLQVNRDERFRAMIQNFQSVAEGDAPLPAGLESVLRPYQKVGFQWLKTLESCHFGGILADEMGLGKTVQVIAYLATVPHRQTGMPSLVVCPTSLILNWGDELARFAPQLRAALLLGPAGERERMMEDCADWDVWVTSYDLLKRDTDRYRTRSFYACILDEAQNIKNQSTMASKAVKRIACRQRYVLTGTPVENRLSELWNLFDFLMPGYLFSHTAFLEKLERPIVQSGDPEARRQLSRLVQPFLLRRLKRDVLKELPPKIEHTRRVPLSEEERKTYLAAAGAAKAAYFGEGQNKLQILAALTQLRQICCDPHLCFSNYQGISSKLEACLELCAGMVENGHQVLVFSQFTSMLERIRQRLEEAGISSFTLQGSTPKEQRAQMVKDFHNGGAQVFLISLKAGGTGLNLTSADVVIHYDPWWNLAAQNQATDRAHRMGQQESVHVYRFIAKDTIEERILELQEKKSALMDAVTGGEGQSILSMSKEELLSLLD